MASEILIMSDCFFSIKYWNFISLTNLKKIRPKISPHLMDLLIKKIYEYIFIKVFRIRELKFFIGMLNKYLVSIKTKSICIPIYIYILNQ